MPDKPAAEVPIDERLVRELLTQAEGAVPDAALRPLSKVAEGWDCEVWRLGEDHAVRLPRRALAAPLILNEQRVLPVIAPAVEATGIRVPVPVVQGAPMASYPWHWSVVPWITGTNGIDIVRADRAGWAVPLAAALGALHVTAPPDHPVNPMRGRPLAARTTGVRDRLEILRAGGGIPSGQLDAAEALWDRGVDAAVWQHEPVWMHGDLHPGNLVAEGGRLRAIVDFGDVTAGDPAGDLAIAWLAFDGAGRRDDAAAARAQRRRAVLRQARSRVSP
ncbi:MAG: aminoglycoside phosphotransferase family protein [Microbacterium sp.]